MLAVNCVLCTGEMAKALKAELKADTKAAVNIANCLTNTYMYTT